MHVKGEGDENPICAGVKEMSVWLEMSSEMRHKAGGILKILRCARETLFNKKAAPCPAKACLRGEASCAGAGVAAHSFGGSCGVGVVRSDEAGRA